MRADLANFVVGFDVLLDGLARKHYLKGILKRFVIAFIDLVAPTRAVCFVKDEIHLCSLSADSAGQLNVLGHDSDALGVDGTQVGVFKQTHKVSLASFLKSHHSRALETQIGLEVLRDFSHKTLEGQLADQQFGGFLITTDLTKSDCTRPVTMRFLDSTGGRRALTSCLSGKLFAWSFSSS